jgi:peptidoglycan hydrolase-like protein with peptidoglycan-binding domain
VPTRQPAELPIFTDDELAWVDPAPKRPAPPQPPPASARRPAPARTLRRDVQAIPLWVLLSLLGTLIAGVLALALLNDDATREDTAQAPSQSPLQVAAEETAVPADGVERIFRLGDRGESVRGLQAAINLLGFTAEAPDGHYGGSTAAAVAAFQQSRGLAGDGVVGPATVGALTTALAEHARADATTAAQGLTNAVAAERLSAKASARYQSILTDVLTSFDRLPPDRSAYVGVVLRDVALHASVYDEPRALTLFAMLETNARYMARRNLRSPPSDIAGSDEVLYRFKPDHGFQFHPLGNFAKLNKLVKRGRREKVGRLSDALLARSIPTRDGIIWEYYFSSSGGPARWASGFAQAIAAQSLARSGDLLSKPALLKQAHAAFRPILTTFSTEVAGGRWILELGFSETLILNAQLQSLVSLMGYADVSRNADARGLVTELETATRALLPEFDNGCWSLYSFGRWPASLHYHTYHVALLKQLAERTGSPFWAEYRARWQRYLETSGGPCPAS